jgi:cytoskeletal protein RodZ
MIFKMENIIIKEENNLEQLSLGELLKKSREALNIKIQEVSSFLKVRPSEIKLLENNDIEKIAKSIYIPGLVKSYGKYLNINTKIINEKIQELSLRSNVEVKKHTLINIGKDQELSPSKEIFFNIAIFCTILFIFFSIFFSLENKNELINTKNIIFEIEKINN